MARHKRFWIMTVATLVGLLPGAGRLRAQVTNDCPSGSALVAKFNRNVVTGIYEFVGPLGNESLVTIFNASAEFGEFTSTVAIGHVVTKGGLAEDDVTYIPPVFSGTFDNLGLEPQGSSEDPPNIGRVSFCEPGGTTTPSRTPTFTVTPSPTLTPTATTTPPTLTPTATDTETATSTPTETATPSDTPTPTQTTTPATETPTPSDTPTPTETTTPATETPTPTETETATPTATATPTGGISPTPTFTPTVTSTPCGGTYTGYDIDFNGSVEPLTDGLLILRYLFGFTGSSLTLGALGQNAQRTDPAAIIAYLDCVRPDILDPDGSGVAEPLTDGLLLLRYFFEFRDAVLIASAVDTDNCVRCLADEIEAYIEAILSG